MVNVNSLVIGEKIEGVFVLNTITKSGDGYCLTLSDKSGKIGGTAREDLITEELINFSNGPVKVSAIVKPGRERKPELIVKGIEKAKSGEYKSSDLYDGLTDEKISEYLGVISNMKRFVHHEGYKALLETALSDETLQRLSVMPATLGYYGRYKGGALAGAALVSLMVKDCGCEYVTHYNGLHQSNIDWSLVLTGALLSTYGVLDFLTPEEPFRKTPIGVDRGYCSVLQSKIERLVITENIPLTEEELSKLFNVVACSVSSRTSVKATSKEGILLRHVIALYSELDMLDYGAEQDRPEDIDETGYFFNSALRRYVTA